MDLDCISSLVTFEHLNLMCRQADRVGVTCEQEKSVPSSPAIPGRRDVLSPPTGNGSSYNFTPPSGWDRRTEEALKDDTVSCVPFCFQLPRLLPKCSRAKLLFSTFVQGKTYRLHFFKSTFKTCLSSIPQNSRRLFVTFLTQRIQSMNCCSIF